MINTQGGPTRNIECEVLDVRGNAIPRLYSAGELGSFYSSIYQGAGNIAECIVTGWKTAEKIIANSDYKSEAMTLPRPFLPGNRLILPWRIRPSTWKRANTSASAMIIDSIINNLQVRIGDFHEPIILKKDESLKNRLAYLESRHTEEDVKEINALKKGIEGEDNVLYQLMHTGIGMYILHGIQIEDAQIDFVVVTRGWIYFIECKNWKGNWIIQNDGTILIKNGDNAEFPDVPQVFPG